MLSQCLQLTQKRVGRVILYSQDTETYIDETKHFHENII